MFNLATLEVNDKIFVTLKIYKCKKGEKKFKMPREYVRKTEKLPEEKLKNALMNVKIKKQSVLSAAKDNKISQSTLWRYKKKFGDASDWKVLKAGRGTIFNEEQEHDLAQHILHFADIYNGLSGKEARILAYDYAMRLNLNVSNWNKNKMGKLCVLLSFFDFGTYSCEIYSQHRLVPWFFFASQIVSTKS